MAAYYRKTLTIFWQSFTLGTTLSSGWFIFYPDSLDCVLPVLFPLRFVPLFKVATFFAPALVLFAVMYIINWALIASFAGEEVTKKREEILANLVDALAVNNSIRYRIENLIDRHAWKSLKLFWRFK
jgi:hypothetical protein